MHATPTRPSATPATPSTILVPHTPLIAAGNQTIATRYGPRNATTRSQAQARVQTQTHQPPAPVRFNDNNNNPSPHPPTDLTAELTTHLLARRAALTTALEQSTSHIARLQLRHRLQAHELLRERAVAAKSTADLVSLATEKNAEIAAAVRQARREEWGGRERKERVVLWRLGAVLVVLVVVVLGYAGWCWINRAGFRYIRGVEERRYGL
ncbi:hypothetical protein B0A55_06606 [Friedmanniomyces simplex]|uniref:Uncharacterized protein n=1 Tax=Friedmanniomyces simplex TaxID=329884 RepID=A0A4U0X3M4_9PEZI|nr:hypothetical protein B0A55_06606 [Friedmanniomyces simplex]